MAYEAYIATCNQIADKVYQSWKTMGDYEALMAKLCKDWNVEQYHVQSKLTQCINDGYYARLLSGHSSED